MFLIDSSHDLATSKLELIADKIAPPELPRISRPRLLELLEHSMTAACPPLLAGRGHGKTALALEFARRCDGGWPGTKLMPLTPTGRFLQLPHQSIQESRPNFGKKSLTSLTDVADLESMTGVANAFVYELAEEAAAKPLLIVIEDLHLVSDANWLTPFFTRVLPLLPAEVHVLITSRNLPSAPMWRMRSKQSLVVIDEAGLAFTRSEAIELFASYGLSREQAGIALDHTHGRAGALNESAKFLQQSPAGDASFGTAALDNFGVR